MQMRHTKPVRRTTAPAVLVSIAYDPCDVPNGPHGFTTAARSWSITTYRRRGIQWERVRSGCSSGITSRQMWQAVESAGALSSRIYVVSPNAADCLTLSGFWRRLDESRYAMRLQRLSEPSSGEKPKKKRPHPLILGNGVDVIGWSFASKEYRIVGYGNHLSIPLLDAARQVGHPDCPPALLAGRPTGHFLPDSDWQAGALSAVYRRLISWWIENQCGRWQDTIGAAGFQWWRTTIEKGDVTEHECEPAVAAETAAVHGGRVQLFWYGSAGREAPTAERVAASPRFTDRHIQTPIYKLDVRSMYASLLRSEVFPVRLIRQLRRATVPQLESACAACLCVATVRVRLASPALPVRSHQTGTVYPTGEFVTTLTTPELRLAFQRREVIGVSDVWLYAPGRPFRAFAERLTELRMDAIRRNDPLGGTWCKTVANALGGRLARVPRGWTTEPDKPCRQRWGQWFEIDAETGERLQLRGIAGVRQRLAPPGPRTGGLTACYAHLTAYGRVLLRSYLETAGERAVLWCDTDGLIVTRDGLDRITAAGLVRDGEPGYLRVEKELDYFCARTPKHYVAGDSWVLSGTRDDYGTVQDNRVIGWQSANPVRSAVEPKSDTIPTRSQLLHIDRIPVSGEPGRDGWIIPPVMMSGGLNQPTDDIPPELLADYYGD